MRTYIGIILLTFFIIGCTPEIDRTNLAPGEDIVSVAQGTQYSRGNLNIGVVNVDKEFATLSIYVQPEDDAEAPAQVRKKLLIGEELVAGGYRIKVLQTETGIGGFMPGQSSGSVTLSIRPD